MHGVCWFWIVCRWVGKWMGGCVRVCVCGSEEGEMINIYTYIYIYILV